MSEQHKQKLSNRQRKKAARRSDILIAAGVDDPGPGTKMNFFSARVAESGDDDVVRSTKVYNAVKIEIEGSKRRPFDPDNDLAKAPCRFKEDTLEPFLLRVSQRLSAGSPKVIFGTMGSFVSPSYKTWDEFITAMLAAKLRTLIAHITLASRIVG